MKSEGYGTGYQYDPDTKDGFSGQNYFPDAMPREEFYKPVERGFERDIQKRLDYWDKLRRDKSKNIYLTILLYICKFLYAFSKSIFIQIQRH